MLHSPVSRHWGLRCEDEEGWWWLFLRAVAIPGMKSPRAFVAAQRSMFNAAHTLLTCSLFVGVCLPLLHILR